MSIEVEAMMRELFDASVEATTPGMSEADRLWVWNNMEDTVRMGFEGAARRALELGATLLTAEDRALRDDITRRGGRT
jgi:hypothetical protein